MVRDWFFILPTDKTKPQSNKLQPTAKTEKDIPGHKVRALKDVGIQSNRKILLSKESSAVF